MNLIFIFYSLFILCLYYNIIFYKNQPVILYKIIVIFLYNILSHYVLFDSLFYDSFLFHFDGMEFLFSLILLKTALYVFNSGHTCSVFRIVLSQSYTS